MTQPYEIIEEMIAERRSKIRTLEAATDAILRHQLAAEIQALLVARHRIAVADAVQ
jgi:hypothetical protein